MAPPSVLLTTHHLEHYAGSELATFDLALEFRKMGYEPTVGTFLFRPPIRELFQEEGLRVVNLIEEEFPAEAYDLIWSQHGPVLYRALSRGVTASRIVFSSLSPYEPLESPPVFANELSLCLANSEETRETLLTMGVLPEKLKVFPNPVREEFFEAFDAQKPRRLKRLGIISNHLPRELACLPEHLAEHDIQMEVIGMQHRFTYLSPALLGEFDGIITIGRSVQAALSMGIPVYCYDRFGGPGWITAKNIDEAGRFNFSGRCCNRQCSTAEIAQEITQGFEIAFSQREILREAARERFSLSRCVQETLARLEETIALNTPVNPFATRLNEAYARELRNRLHFEQSFADRTIQYQQLSALHEEREAKVQALFVQSEHQARLIETLKQDNQALKQENGRLIMDIHQLLSSFSWKITTPLRAMRQWTSHSK